MPIYYVNRNEQSNGDHEVHESTCSRLPLPENRIYLGTFNSCREAVIAAHRYFTQVDGCYYCCPSCHKH